MKPLNPLTATGRVLAGLVALTAAETLCTGAPTAPTEWPRVIYRNGVTNTIYHPQLQSWDYLNLKALAVVAVQPKGADQPTFGTIQFTSRTRVDRAERIVYLEQLEIPWGSFPSAGPYSKGYMETLRSLVPKRVESLSLDQMEASLAILQARQKSAGKPLNNTPPAIIFSTLPAVLITVSGPPEYRPVEKTGLERIINTRALILRDEAGKHFLHLYDGYVEARGLGGPWTTAQNVPDDVQKAEKQAVKAKAVDLLAGQENPRTKQKPSLKSTPLPALYVRSVPTELIVIRGEPQWIALPQTTLLYVSNTVSHVFKRLTDQKTYVLISGRWFRSPGFEGPWEFVSGTALPRDFTAIPDDSPKENVKASIPGTRQAEEAAVANGIPSTVKVSRSKATTDPPPEYDGSPNLTPIPGTPLN
ncbi:MAG: autotransporter, partial [Deltaproteobacteria bacterium]|nr:autotransporter [Deltaproteobacteria bacterium]